MTKQPATVRVARWSATHPWRAIALWLLFVAVCVMVGGAAGRRDANDRELGVGESGRITTMLHDAGLDDPTVENVLITARTGHLDPARASAVAAEAAARMDKLPGVARTDPPVTAADGTAVILPVTMRGDPGTAKDRVAPLLAQTAAVQHAHPDLRVEEVGGASLEKGIWDQVAKDLGTAESFSMPVTLLILLVAFGAIVAAGVPILLAVSAVLSATGLASLASHIFPDSGTTSNVILMMGMAVGIDYSLFYLKREREERARGRGHLDAVEVAAATSGHSVVVSGIAVMVAMAGLYLAGDATFSSLATGSIIVVAVAVVGSLTVLPALLAKLGRAVDRPRVPVLWRLTTRSGPPRVWPRLLRPALRRPGATLLVALIFLVGLGLPAAGMKLKNSSNDDLPRSIPAMRGYDRLTKAFPSEYTPQQVAVKAAPEQAPRVVAALDELVRRTATDRLFTSDTRGERPRVRASADGRVHTVDLVSPYASTSTETRDAVRELRHALLPATVGQVPGAEYGVAGDTAANLDYAAHVKDKLPLVMGFVLLLTFVMMVAAFRSVVLALTAIAVNLLSALAAFGALVLVFQHHWAEGLLNFHSSGAVISWLPLFQFVVLFGLSMDYHVFVVSRIREAVQRGMPTREAVEYGITRSAGVVTSAAIVMVSVFAVFTTLAMLDMKQMGFGLAAAVLLDAFLVRAVLLPSAMILLGRANWWPSGLSRRRHGTPGQATEVPSYPVAARHG
ncbi:MAG: MMPL family transporter [Mycobacteriales bacterium]